MASLAELARARTDLDAAAINQMQRLVRRWGLLADLSFSDLLVHVPVAEDDDRFIVVAHVRPATGPSVVPGDPVGEEVPPGERALLERAWRDQRRVEGLVVRGVDHPGLDDVVEEDIRLAPLGDRLVIDHVPVGSSDGPVGVMTRKAEPALLRYPSQLEGTYRELYDRIAQMVSDGVYPFSDDGAVDADGVAVEFREPRVGDGVLVLDLQGRAEYASPNAISALHRLGVHGNVSHRRLADCGVDDRSIRRALNERRSTIAELEYGVDLTVVVRTIPLLEDHRLTGAMVVTRDISELRRRDRMLVSKDATIREIHHRVKNNLQTISSMLRLQARRVEAPEAKWAVEQSVRRIASIATVHEVLSRGVEDAVDFDEIVRPVIRLADERLDDGGRTSRITVDGSLGRLPGEVAMPLAVVLNELVQNAVEHGHGASSVSVSLAASGEHLSVTIADDGVGIGDGFSLERDAGLGLTIVRTFVVNDLGGTVVHRAGDGGIGTRVEVRVPRPLSGRPVGG